MKLQLHTCSSLDKPLEKASKNSLATVQICLSADLKSSSTMKR